MPLIAYEILEIIGNALTQLSEHLKDGKLSNEEAAQLFQQIISDLIRKYYD